MDTTRRPLEEFTTAPATLPNNPPGRGGNFIFSPGKGGRSRSGTQPNGADGDFIFERADGTEALRLCGDGRCFVNGDLIVTNEPEIYYAFKTWFRDTIKTPGVDAPLASNFTLELESRDPGRQLQFLKDVQFLGVTHKSGVIIVATDTDYFRGDTFYWCCGHGTYLRLKLGVDIKRLPCVVQAD